VRGFGPNSPPHGKGKHPRIIIEFLRPVTSPFPLAVFFIGYCKHRYLQRLQLRNGQLPKESHVHNATPLEKKKKKKKKIPKPIAMMETLTNRKNLPHGQSLN
jgi:hypothetical protein